MTMRFVFRAENKSHSHCQYNQLFDALTIGIRRTLSSNLKKNNKKYTSHADLTFGCGSHVFLSLTSMDVVTRIMSEGTIIAVHRAAH